ncbi:ABC transporter permease [Microbacterium sp. GXF0217]
MNLRSKSATATGAVEVDLDLRSVKGPSSFVKWLRAGGTWVLLLDLVLILVFGLLSPGNVFWSLQNFQSLALAGTQLMLISLGLAVFLAAGYIDISVGANLVLSSVFGARAMLEFSGPMDAGGNYATPGLGITMGLLVALLVGVLFGLINGFVIGFLGVNSLIATLGTTGIATGVALLLTSGSDIGQLPIELQSGFGLQTIGPIPLPVLVAVLVALLLWVMMRYSKLGVHTLSLGSSRVAAQRAGIRVRSLILGLAALSGLTAGLAGFVSIAHYGATTVTGHANDPLAAITAVVIGGTALEGGRLSLAGTVWGVGLTVLLQGGLIIIGVPSFWQLIAVGAVLIAAVALDRFRAKGRQDT